MKALKSIIVSILMVCGCLVLPGVAFAAPANDNVDCAQAPQSAFCEQIKKVSNPLFGPDGVLTKAASLLALLTGIISVFLMIWGGMKFVLSTGDPQKITTARNTILYAAIGLAVAVSAQAIVIFILNRI